MLRSGDEWRLCRTDHPFDIFQLLASPSDPNQHDCHYGRRFDSSCDIFENEASSVSYSTKAFDKLRCGANPNAEHVVWFEGWRYVQTIDS